MSCKPGEACWIRAGDPLLLHWMSGDPQPGILRRALCGDASIAWRCVDEDGPQSGTECPRCAAQGGGPLDDLPS